MPDPFIIAEVAQGYEGSADQAAVLVRAASAAGVDAVKMQLVYADELATPDYEHFALFRKLEMPDLSWQGIAQLASSRGVQFHLDVFGPRSLGLAEKLNAAAIKIHSTDMSNPGLLAAVAASSISRVLLSVGGCFIPEIDRAVFMLAKKQLVLLHGFQGYPTLTGANQIFRLRQLASRFCHRSDVLLGFADHADPDGHQSMLLCAAALGAGATVLEKHITLAKVMKLEDHESALNPDEFAEFTRHMRACAAALGMVPRDGSSIAKDVQASAPAADFGMHETERAYRGKTRKHVVAARDIEAGTRISAGDIALKRTASRVYLEEADDVIGRTLNHAIKRDEAITPNALGVAP
ncbi:MAG: NeuB family protein [Betaproteobacteria bacterium]|nr:NeuB family protein [Betaproteobacteria bacterium]